MSGFVLAIEKLGVSMCIVCVRCIIRFMKTLQAMQSMSHHTINPPVLGRLEYEICLLLVPIRLLDFSISTRTCAKKKDCKSYRMVLLHLNNYHNTGGCKVRVAGHCFILTETTQTFAKNANLRRKCFFLGGALC